MLRELDRDLWCLDQDLRMSAGMHMPVRMTVVRTEQGLWLHSPVAIDDATAKAIDSLGPVRDIVAPSLLHHLYARAACERWPSATLHGPASLAHKRPDLALGRTLAEDARWPELTVI